MAKKYPPSWLTDISLRAASVRRNAEALLTIPAFPANDDVRAVYEERLEQAIKEIVEVLK